MTLAWIIGIILSLGYIYLVFKLGKKESTFMWFLGLLVLSTLALVLQINWDTFVALINNSGKLLVLYFILFMVERYAWFESLKESSGKDELVWFYIIFIVPIFGWLLYKVTRIR